MRVRNQLVTSRKYTTPGTNPRLYITVHETANRSRGANAQAHANLQSRGNLRGASWHIQVDDREAIRSYPDTVRCWHAGDGGGPGNMSSIGIEICVNSDGNYERALANAAAVVRDLRAKYGIPASRVVQHNHWSGKNCPTILRSRGGWVAFVATTEPRSHAGAPSPGGSPGPTLPTFPTLPPRDWFDMASKDDLRDVLAEQLTVTLSSSQQAALATNQATWNLRDLVAVLAHRVGLTFQRVETLRDDSPKIKTALQETQENSRLLERIADKTEKTNHAVGRLEQAAREGN